MTLLEVSVDDIEGAIAAECHGVDRIELCAGLSEGGTTPSIGTVSIVLKSVEHIGIQVLVRQRGGDFVYSPYELDAMCADIEAFRALTKNCAPPLGFVVGALSPEGEIDIPATERIVQACGDAPITFHRAFDITPDLKRSLKTLAALGIGRVLTSGGHVTASAGSNALATLVQQSAGQLLIIAAGGIRPNNVVELIARTRVPEVHLRAAQQIASASFRSGDQFGYDSGSRLVTSPRVIDDMLAVIAASGVAR